MKFTGNFLFVQIKIVNVQLAIINITNQAKVSGKNISKDDSNKADKYQEPHEAQGNNSTSKT